MRRFRILIGVAVAVIRDSFKPAPLANFVCNGSGARRQAIVKFGPAYRVEQRTESDQSEFFVSN
jgi:hypothetical protein